VRTRDPGEEFDDGDRHGGQDAVEDVEDEDADKCGEGEDELTAAEAPEAAELGQVDQANSGVDDDPSPRWFVLNMEGITEVDITGLDALEDVREHCAKRGIVMALDHVKSEVWSDLERHGVGARIGRHRIFPTHPTAVAAYEEWSASEGHSKGSG